MKALHLCAILFLTSVAAAEPTRLYVAPNGNDAWSGALPTPNEAGTDGPLATPARARDAARTARATGPVEVVFAAGVYDLSEPLAFTSEDSGTSEAPVVYTAAPDAEARLRGGRTVTGFKPVTDEAVRARLDESARDRVRVANLGALGITDYGEPNGGGLELYFNGAPMTPARWPNEGFVRIVDLVVEDGHQIHGIPGSKTGQFVYDGDRPRRWRDEKDPWLHGYWFWDWSDQRMRIADIDVENSVITLEPPEHNYGYRKGQWYYAFNMLCELDAPGEWYLDRDAGLLYFWPPASLDDGEAVVSVASTLATLEGASHVTLRGFTFEAARDTALTVDSGEGVRIDGCTFRNIGGNAVDVSGGRDHGVLNGHFYNLGGSGILMSGGDRTTLEPGGHFADNNHIHDYGRWYRMYRAAIHLWGVGNRASHNLIHDAPHMAIFFGGNDHVIEFNEIHHVCLESNDAGAMYAGRNWTMRGTVIRHNYLHHITGFEDRGCVGVYLDDMYCGTRVVGNVFYKVTAAAFIGGGRDNLVQNNVFVECAPALHVDARALGWAHYHADEWIKEGQEKGTVSGIAFDKPPYSDRYPELVNLLQDEPKAPRGNVVARNVCWGGRWEDVEEAARPHIRIENNLVEVDPRFHDAENLDFRLRDDSPAFALGFEPIPVEDIGLRKAP